MLGKVILHRTRPDVAIYAETTFSFPSAHATIATAFYGFLIYIVLGHVKSLKRRVNVLFFGISLISLIGFSRLYLGVHYLSDVWGGYLVGALWLIIGIILSEFLRIRKKHNLIISGARKKSLISVMIVMSVIGAYINTAVNYREEIVLSLGQTHFTQVTNIDDIFTVDTLKYTETLLGTSKEPLSFIIVAHDDDQLINVFDAAGWELADDITFASLFQVASAAFFGTSYPNAPITPDFWNAKVHDYGFEQETDVSSARERHHARFWKTNYTTPDGDFIYVGMASFDDGIKWAITHSIRPDVDTERDFLLSELESTDLIESSIEQAFVDPILGTNFTGDAFFTDGNLYLIELK